MNLVIERDTVYCTNQKQGPKKLQKSRAGYLVYLAIELVINWAELSTEILAIHRTALTGCSMHFGRLV